MTKTRLVLARRAEGDRIVSFEQVILIKSFTPLFDRDIKLEILEGGRA